MPRLQFGVLFGYEESSSQNADDQLKARDFYFGLYGAYFFHGGADARIVFAQGWQHYCLDRTGIANVLYSTSFNGGTSEANLEFGKRFRCGGWSLRPVLAADMFYNNLQAARETVSNPENVDSRFVTSVDYDKAKLTQVFFRTGTDLRHRTHSYTFNSGIYFAHDAKGAELKTRVASVTNPEFSAPLVGSKIGKSLLLFNLGIDFEVAANFSAFVGYQGEYAMDSAKDALHSISSVGCVGKW
jgi:outer membrane autotransporter protein